MNFVNRKTKLHMNKDLILVVDDQPNNLKVIASILQDDYVLSFANNGLNALKMLEKKMPDLILLDVMMPDMDGYEVCRRILSDPKSKHIPVIFLSAKTNIDDIVKGFQSGAVDYITKPFNSLEVKVRVKNHLNLHHALDQKAAAEHKLKENQRLLQSVLQSQKEMICRFNTESIISFVNTSFADFFGKSEKELIGQNWIELFPMIKHGELRQLLWDLLENPDDTITYQQKVFTREGIKRWHEWKGYAVCDGEKHVSEFQFIGYDITDMVERQELEKEVELARNTLKFKQNFLASMSHEIRTPLTGIIGISEMLQNTRLDYTQKDYMNTLQMSADNLREIIDQVLDYSRIESGNVQLNIGMFSLEELMTHAQKFFNGICRKPLEFYSEIDPELPYLLLFDHKRLMQVMNNLITNSVKFTEQGSVSVKISKDNRGVVPQNEIHILVEVVDTGIGIREEKQKNIFSPFSQVQKIDTEEYSGIGLGLSICKEIVEMHGGNMGVKSKTGKGTTVWFTFKSIIPEQSADQKTNVQREGKGNLPEKKLRILYAEDKITTQKIVKLMLNSMGHEVTLVNNGKEALEANDPAQFDVILMDIQMPVMDGITATRKLKEQYTDLPPIVALSANAFEGDREKYLAQGMDEYITKPVKKEDFQELFSTIFS